MNIMLRASIKQLINRNPKQKREGHLAIADNPRNMGSDSCSQTSWLGTESQDWENPSNWSNDIPKSNNHAYIPSSSKFTHNPVISHSLTIDFTLKIEGLLYNKGTITIIVKGLIQNDGVIKIDSGGGLINNGKIHNSGTIHNRGLIDNNKVFSNNGNIENEGIIKNAFSIVNLKTFFNAGYNDSDTESVENQQIENFNHFNILSE